MSLLRSSSAALAAAILLAAPAALAASPAARPAPRPAAARTTDLLRRLEINNLDLCVNNLGGVGFDMLTYANGLTYPRGSDTGLLFAGGLWVGALVEGSPRLAVAEYSSEFGPGSVLASGGWDDPLLGENQVWKVMSWTGNPADTAHAERTAAELEANPSLDPILHHGWGEYLANAVPHGAPARDWVLPAPGGSGTVTVRGPGVRGDQVLWCVFNDADPSQHTNSAGSTPPLGIEVRQEVFAANCSGPLGTTAFVHWRIFNKGGAVLQDARAAYWSDPDIGYAGDDLVGSDSTRSLVYAYNGTNNDLLYGSSTPALGVDLLDDPLVPGHGAATTARFINGTDPYSAAQSWNVMQGLRPDGSPIVNPTTGTPTSWSCSGSPVLGSGWLDSSPADRRMMITSPPRTLAPGDSMDVWAALVVGQGSNRLASVTQMLAADDYVQAIFAAGGPDGCRDLTAIAATLVSATATPGRAELAWSVTDVARVTVQRAGEDGGWSALGTADVDGAGRVAWTDTDVVPGARYGWRLALGEGGGAPYAGETWLDVPRTPSLAVLGFVPNPARGPVALRFSLPGSGRASLQVLDVAGRVVATRDVTAYGPGVHQAPLGTTLAHGLYWIRLAQGGQTVTGRGVMMR